MSRPHADALVFFGATGDLAYKKIFPSLQAMLKRGHLDVPVIGVAKAGWTLDQLKARARDSLEQHGGGVDARPSTSSAGCCATSTGIMPTRRPSRPCAASSALPSVRPTTWPSRPRCSERSSSSSPRQVVRPARASSSRSPSVTTWRPRAS